MKNTCLFLVCLVWLTSPAAVLAEAADGCVATPEVPGCNGCACEACVCEADAWCCENEWDGLCVSECVEDCAGDFCLANCGNGTCDDDGIETCDTCPADCGCPVGQICEWGECCQPDCTGKQCGYDGCGGSCGECPEGSLCTLENQCEVCTPDCVDMQCGGDGCGGSCGECAEGLFCADGKCVAGGTCEGLCGEGIPGDCYCDEQCDEFGDCCADVCNFCPELPHCSGCTPDCTDKLCSEDNGCGSPCGCEAEMLCCDDGACKAACTDICEPQCVGKACGPDGCSGECGQCLAGTKCAEGVCAVDNGCTDVCVQGEKGCDENTAWICVVGAAGCTVRTETVCGGTLVCQLGACVPGDNTEDPDTDPEPADDSGKGGGGSSGCALGAVPGSLVPLLMLLLGLWPVIRLRRRRG